MEYDILFNKLDQILENQDILNRNQIILYKLHLINIYTVYRYLFGNVKYFTYLCVQKKEKKVFP